MVLLRLLLRLLPVVMVLAWEPPSLSYWSPLAG